MKRRIALVALSALLAQGCTKSKPQFSGIDLTGADYAKDFQLPDQNGQVRSLKDFRGKLVAVFFGYTQCPDVCPTTLTDMVQVKQMLGADADKLQVIFVTVDPERDTPQVLKAYMANFDPSFIALSGSPEQTAAVAKDFKIYYRKAEGKTPAAYTVDHSAATYVYDAQGRLRLYTRYGSGAQALASDLKLLLQEG